MGISLADRGKKNNSARFHGRVEGQIRQCEHPGCELPGEFRAPRHHRSDNAAPAGGLGDERWHWFCLEHVRAFNDSYNFFAGMSEEEIYNAQRPFAGWERESRAFATNGSPPPRWADFQDPLDAIGARFKRTAHKRYTSHQKGKAVSSFDEKALKTLGLDADTDRQQLRKRYAELLRRYHPDRNGGDRTYEKALQDVIAAYTHLKSSAIFA
ncbi:MAG: J domain-containing protein [Zymomonas mobilis subsp. pomaceae]|uniref:Heat shock protein DnaJ domain protein n=1 Tax=Zymomonas mobilis subsp. pomaceae (strain ATCC 29192 / DSM 22645 / JCM 10191 / CCUG 17912 / NBRC 13757 / NCIMB 11200 / NRRL B-4491 / Barker I) TaxID=579138 RepID=F8EW39_ZYMMT|nr:J domain-containing protein [Zymomonas mobilis]AEI38449.1 heat shock protein DnaJ domain protein [Zymomonas mobilis subsp. pomaceae ATCC 29192]MDX5948138.1 J domain-containing protein [Zymomonas mobilis subsp. pomaceae]GEB89751.1 molecular chaperone DnaJ [Zymomonas mobilis subsp. pomaceae]